MAFQSVPDTASIYVQYSLETTTFGNTLYAKKGGGYDINDLSVLASYIDTWASAYVISHLNVSTSYVGTTVRGLENENDLVVIETPAAPVAGLVTGGPLPINVAWVVKFTTGLTGKSARGRNYIGGFAESSTSSVALSVTIADQIRNEYGILINGLVSVGWEWVIVSRYTNNAKRPVGVTFPVTGVAYTDTRLDTRRGRITL